MPRRFNSRDTVVINLTGKKPLKQKPYYRVNKDSSAFNTCGKNLKKNLVVAKKWLSR